MAMLAACSYGYRMPPPPSLSHTRTHAHTHSLTHTLSRYELGVLKPMVEPLLRGVKPDDQVVMMIIIVIILRFEHIYVNIHIRKN